VTTFLIVSGVRLALKLLPPRPLGVRNLACTVSTMLSGPDEGKRVRGAAIRASGGYFG
jgi:hypothetical protein